MSGRLIILSKKGYCPWSAKNLARIDRDEKEHQEAQERERNKQASLASNARLSALKKTSECEVNEHERFNLFEVEEKGSFERIYGHRQEKERKRSATEVYDTETTLKNKDNSQAANFGRFAHKNLDPAKAFYLAARPTQESLGRKEMKRIRDMDPMRQFHEEPEFQQVTSNRNEINNNFPNQDSTYSSSGVQSSKKGRASTYETKEEKQKRKRKKHRRRDRSHKHKRRSRSSREKSSRSEENGAKSLELQELRERRADREKRERQREKAILKGVQTPHLRRDES